MTEFFSTPLLLFCSLSLPEFLSFSAPSLQLQLSSHLFVYIFIRTYFHSTSSLVDVTCVSRLVRLAHSFTCLFFLHAPKNNRVVRGGEDKKTRKIQQPNNKFSIYFLFQRSQSFMCVCRRTQFGASGAAPFLHLRVHVESEMNDLDILNNLCEQFYGERNHNNKNKNIIINISFRK